MLDKEKHAAKEWYFLYERGKEVGRQEIEEIKKELAQAKYEIKVYKSLFKEVSDYLETNKFTCISNSSLFHQKFRELGE